MVIIICYEHGPFQELQTTTPIKRIQMASKCGLQRRVAKRRLHLKNLLKEESKNLEINMTTLEVNIINVDSDVLIGCPIHGVIPMTPIDILNLKQVANNVEKLSED